MAIPPAQDPAVLPRGVLVIAAILVLEAVAIAVLAVLALIPLIGGTAVSVGGSVFMAVLLALVAAALIAMARSLTAGMRWPRTPSLVLQVFLVILAFPYFSTGSPVLGLAFLVPAAVVIVLLFSQPVVRFTVRVSADGRTL